MLIVTSGYTLKGEKLFQVCKLELAFVVVTRLLLRDGGMAEDHVAPEARKLSRAWTKGCQRASSAKNS